MPRHVVLYMLRVAVVVPATISASSGAVEPGGGQPASYRNPVLPGDYPDPSVIRVGREYWATATTSQWAPVFPLLRSTDLVNWRLVGSVFERPPAWSAGSYWAPDISEDLAVRIALIADGAPGARARFRRFPLEPAAPGR